MDTTMMRSLIGSRGAPELVFRRSYRATPAELRNACTDPERLARWFGTVEPPPQAVGDTFIVRLSADPADRAQARVLRCDETQVVISWSWQGESTSTITARFVPVSSERTELVLHHSLSEADHAAGYGGGWEQMLGALGRAIGVNVPGSRPDHEIDTAAATAWSNLTRTPLQLDHAIDAPLEQVWAAFASADGLRPWWWSHWDDVQIEADVRIGGRYRVRAPSVGIDLSGEYLAVQTRERLAFTWEWTDADGTSVDEAVDLQFREDGRRTVISIRHTGPWADDQPAEAYRQGWTFVLGALASNVLRRSGPGPT